jgi:putative heme-binding domain-containing protein
MTAMVSPKSPAPEGVVAALKVIAMDTAEKPALRAQALRLLTGVVEKNTEVVAEAYLALAGDEPQPAPMVAAWEEFTHDAGLARKAAYFATLVRDADPAKRALGAAVLVSVASNPVLKDNQKNNARRAMDRMWETPEQAATLLRAIGKTRVAGFASQVRERLDSKDASVAEAARFASARLGLDKAGTAPGKTIAELGYDAVVASVAVTKGDPQRGQQIFMQQACFVCHTVSANEAPKGPMLGGIAQRYSRAELCESIMKPSAKIAQGFESQYFKLKSGEDIEGFVTREGGDSLSVRNVAGVTTEIEKGSIDKREKREKSIMPEGLVASLSPDDLASLLAYLESTASK